MVIDVKNQTFEEFYYSRVSKKDFSGGLGSGLYTNEVNENTEYIQLNSTQVRFQMCKWLSRYVG